MEQLQVSQIVSITVDRKEILSPVEIYVYLILNDVLCLSTELKELTCIQHADKCQLN